MQILTQWKVKHQSKEIYNVLRVKCDGRKRQINMKQCLVRHQELLDELKLLEEFTNRDEPPVPEICERGAQISGVQIEKPDGQFKNDTENYEHGTSSNFNGNSTGGANTMNVKPAGQGGGILQHDEIEKGIHYGPYNAAGKNSAFVLKTAKRMNRIGTLCDSNKRKLDLYDVSTKRSKELVDCEVSTNMRSYVS
uniref:Arginine--tRNA ligase n=1 Tax=Lygus hesperus TaxID=30085 RepID=A0A0A9W5Y5_LYGHE